MSEMVERVARALYAKSHSDRTPWIAPEWDHLMPDVRTTYRNYAKAAIEAMKVPTEAMLKAEMFLGGYAYGDEVDSADPKVIWTTMIEEALK